MRNLFIIILLSLSAYFLLAGCRSTDQNARTPFSPDSLQTFSADIPINKDTTLRLPGGSIIHIPANALEAGGATRIKLQIREALKISDIIKAGLITNSSGHMLSSGGMIEIRAASGQSVAIKKPLSVKLPTPFVQKDMQLFKGEIETNGKLNWVDPTPLAQTKADATINTGKMLFTQNCASCHGLKETITGPELAYIDKRRPRHWLDHFIINNQKVLQMGDQYANCLYERFNKTPMPLYPQLTLDDLDALCKYIDNESARQGLPMPTDTFYNRIDSCKQYDSARYELLSRRKQLLKENGARVEITRDTATQKGIDERDKAPGDPKVEAQEYQSEYYEFKITTFGWYNVDIMLKLADALDSKLVVRLQGPYANDVNVYLTIPSVKVFDGGGRLEGADNQFGFYATDGTLPLPQGRKAYIFTIGEAKGQAIFTIQSFTTSLDQNFDLTPQPTTKEAINTAIKDLDLDNFSFQAKNSKNAAAIRAANKELKDIESLKPKNCDCNCSKASEPDSLHKTIK